MALPSGQELEVLNKFRDRVTHLVPEEERGDDMFLLRWLRAREMDVEKAELMLSNAVKWRKANNLDSMVIGKTVSDYFYKKYPYYLDGTDKEGRPVFSVPLQTWDVRELINKGKSAEFVQYITEGFEDITRAIRFNSKRYPPKPGCPPVTQMIGIYDYSGVAWGQLFNIQAIRSFLHIGSFYEAYYPEILHTFYFINCPSLISTVLTLLKPVIAPKTLAKIKCFGTDKSVWQAELLQHIDADQLRPRFGGTKEN